MSKQKVLSDESNFIVQEMWKSGALKREENGSVTLVNDPEEQVELKQQYEIQQQMIAQQQQ